MIRTEYHEVDGQKKEIPVQCDKCTHYIYYNGVKQICQKHIDNNGQPKRVCAGYVCDDWEWCGF